MDWSPVWISMRAASLSILITFFLGIFAAWGVMSIKNRLWRFVWDGILTLPLVLPPTVAGFFLLYIFGVKRPVGQFFLDYFSVKIAFSWGATVIAAVTMSFPLMYRSARGAFEQVDPDLLAAARTLGVNLTLTCLVILGIKARGMYLRLGMPEEENGVYLVAAVQWKQALLFAGFANWVLIITICTFVFTLMYLNHRERRFAGPEDDPC